MATAVRPPLTRSQWQALFGADAPSHTHRHCTPVSLSRAGAMLDDMRSPGERGRSKPSEPPRSQGRRYDPSSFPPMSHLALCPAGCAAGISVFAIEFSYDLHSSVTWPAAQASVMMVGVVITRLCGATTPTPPRSRYGKCAAWRRSEESPPRRSRSGPVEGEIEVQFISARHSGMRSRSHTRFKPFRLSPA
jgi:hypothetical protein